MGRYIGVVFGVGSGVSELDSKATTKNLHTIIEVDEEDRVIYLVTFAQLIQFEQCS